MSEKREDLTRTFEGLLAVRTGAEFDLQVVCTQPACLPRK